MRFGFIYPLTEFLVEVMCLLNSAEWVKWGTERSWSWWDDRTHTTEQIRMVKSLGIDLHQVLKWSVLVSLIAYGGTSTWAFYLVAYLIAGNLFTYFYYHTWGSGYARKGGIDARRRRFVAFILSIAFYLVAYAYLYQFHLAEAIEWPKDGVNFFNAFYGSVTTAFTLTHGDFTPQLSSARAALLTELLNTFAFLTIIITDAVPRIEDNE
jgi:hypothetical protein